MKVLVACEESQEVCKAFRELGHEAYSCDIEPCSGGHPEWHLQCDALELLKIMKSTKECLRGIEQRTGQRHFMAWGKQWQSWRSG